jgi:H+/gluconate symporter-like permease
MSTNMSPPMPFITGSTTVSAIAAASALSMALPPLYSMLRPACAASGWLALTTLAASSGIFCAGYGNVQSKGSMVGTARVGRDAAAA